MISILYYDNTFSGKNQDELGIFLKIPSIFSRPFFRKAAKGRLAGFFWPESQRNGVNPFFLICKKCAECRNFSGYRLALDNSSKKVL